MNWVGGLICYRAAISPCFCFLSWPNPDNHSGITATKPWTFSPFIKGELLEIIEFTDDSRDTLSWRFPDDGKAIKNDAQLIVR